MTGPRHPFDWIVDEATTWPPRMRPKPPFGPTNLEVIRSCPLRACFDVSEGYERRMDFAGRVGTAFHATLQSLSENPPRGSSQEEVTEEARRRFQTELEKQERERALRPRERGLPRDESRVTRAAEAVIVEAQRSMQAAPAHAPDKGVRGTFSGSTQPSGEAAEHLPLEEIGDGATDVQLEIEVPVASKDGLFRGRVDRAEHLQGGTRLVDYKSSVRDDLPGRYERQLQLYSLMWHDTRGEWPIEGEVVYPLTSSAHRIAVDPEVSEDVADAYRALISWLREERSVDNLAIPGDTCKVCEFRPWCRPFWRWQAAEQNHAAALERAFLGFEGTITGLETIDHYWKLTISWRNIQVRVVTPVERFPQLKSATVGMRIRCIEMRLHGQRFQPQATVTEYSEVFLVRAEESS